MKILLSSEGETVSTLYRGGTTVAVGTSIFQASYNINNQVAQETDFRKFPHNQGFTPGLAVANYYIDGASHGVMEAGGSTGEPIYTKFPPNSTYYIAVKNEEATAKDIQIITITYEEEDG